MAALAGEKNPLKEPSSSEPSPPQLSMGAFVRGLETQPAYGFLGGWVSTLDAQNGSERCPEGCHPTRFSQPSSPERGLVCSCLKSTFSPGWCSSVD